MTDKHPNLPDVAAFTDPIPDPGLPHHHPRPTDVDPAAADRAERQVAFMFVLSMVCTVLFVVAYFTLDIKDNHDTFLGLGASNVALGLSLGGSLLLIGIGVIQWARKLMGDQEITELRHAVASSEEDREAALAGLTLGLEESALARRPLLRNTMLGAIGLVPVTMIVGARDLYPEPLHGAVDKLETTFWKEGTRLVNDVTGLPIKVSDMEIGQLVNGEPEGLVHVHEPREGVEYPKGVELQVAKTKAAIVAVRMEPRDIKPGKGRENWGVEGIVCYSKICTHVGCPISLWEQQTHHLLCPCHQSTFDLGDSGRVVFGPAARALPQLPIAVDSEGYLVAQSDFTEPVGPSYWERDSN